MAERRHHCQAVENTIPPSGDGGYEDDIRDTSIFLPISKIVRKRPNIVSDTQTFHGSIDTSAAITSPYSTAK